MTKQIKVREDNYFAVQGWMVTELKLKGNALMLYAIIYGFSQTTNTAFTGSVDYLCEWLGGVSRPTVINTLDNLVKQGLLTKSSTTRLLIIDDIGAERVTDWVRERMVSIINTRVSNNLTTIYTSNLSPEELRGELGDRIASRVLGSSQVVEITSGDRRGL